MTRIANKVVVHFRDGRILKGYTYDFNPNREIFHVASNPNGKQLTEVSTSHMKALFFVKSFEGNKDHPGPHDFCIERFRKTPGTKVKVTFQDREVMYGSTHGYAPNRRGFFISPASSETNNDRIFVVKESTSTVETWRRNTTNGSEQDTESALALFADSLSESVH